MVTSFGINHSRYEYLQRFGSRRRTSSELREGRKASGDGKGPVAGRRAPSEVRQFSGIELSDE